MRAAAAPQPAAVVAARTPQRAVRAAAARAAKSRSPAPPAPANGGGAPAALPPTLPGQRGGVIQLEMEPQLERELQENGGSLGSCPTPTVSSNAAAATCCRAPLPSAGTLVHIAYDRRSAGFRSTRRTKLIATIGPACDSEQMLEQMAVGGTPMVVAPKSTLRRSLWGSGSKRDARCAQLMPATFNWCHLA